MLPFLRRAWGERGLYAIGIVLAFLVNALDVGLTKAMGRAIAEVEAGAGADRALGWVATIVIGSSFLFLLQGGLRNLVFLAGRRIERDLRTGIERKIVRLPATVRDRFRIGDLASRLVNDVSDIRMFVGVGFLQVVNTIFAFGLSILLMLRIDAPLTAWALLPYPVIFLASRFLTRAAHDRSLAEQEALGRLSDRAHEGIAGILAVKASAAEGWRARILSAYGEVHRTAALRLARAEALLAGVMGVGIPLGVVMILFVGGRDRIAGRIGTEDLVTLVLLLMKLAWPAIAMGWVMNVFQRGSAAMGRVGSILDSPLRGAGRPSATRREVPKTPIGIRLNDLRWGYPSEAGAGKEILRGLSLEVRPGELLGIAGPTASGKSTLLALIAGEYDPPPGSILLDGTDLLAWDLAAHRAAVALSAQKPHLFSMRFEENLRLANPEADRDEIEEALRTAALEDDVAHFPEGLSTPVGERGITLSGGQRARAAIARALLADPAVLLLDDPCAAVDLSTEARIRERLARKRRGKTTVLVSQRLSTLQDCDRIAVVAEGRVIEAGSHDELVAIEDGWYAAAWEAETLRAELAK